MSSPIPRIVVEALGASRKLERYFNAIEAACAASPPPYGQRFFAREFSHRARDSSWFASLLYSNAYLEGYSARQLWAYGLSVSDPHFSRGVLAHASDEARHAGAFGDIFVALFPAAVTSELRANLAAMKPNLPSLNASTRQSNPNRETPTDELINSAILINLHEVKALILEFLLRPVIAAYARGTQRDRLASVMEAIIADEVRHIRYSAVLIEGALQGNDAMAVRELVVDFQDTLNAATLQELDAEALDIAALVQTEELKPCIS